MRQWVVRALVLAAAAGATVSVPVARQAQGLSVRDAVALYARGDFSTAVRDLHVDGLTVAPFTRALDEWIAEADPADKPRRRVIAAAFALDANWTASRSPSTPYQPRWDAGRSAHPERQKLAQHDSQGLVAEWATRQLPASGAVEPVERTLWRAVIGVASDGEAWYHLRQRILPLAERRVPDDARVRLAVALVRANQQLLPLRRWTHGGRDLLRNEPLGSTPIRRIPSAIRTFEPLLADPDLAAEAELRIGYLELRRKDWTAALSRFEATCTRATEPFLRAAADYFAGWVLEQLDRTDDAIEAYRRAHAITPTMRNLTTRLASLLFLRNERVEAHWLLDVALNARPAPDDLMVVMERGDARFVPEWLASIREALK